MKKTWTTSYTDYSLLSCLKIADIDLDCVNICVSIRSRVRMFTLPLGLFLLYTGTL